MNLWVLQTRLLHSLQLANAVSSLPTYSSASQAPETDTLPPFERIWSAPALSSSPKPYVAADAVVDQGGLFNISRSWGWTSATESLCDIHQKGLWLADDELALEAVLHARQGGADERSLHEELQLERALVALSAAIAASKEKGQLVAAPLRAFYDRLDQAAEATCKGRTIEVVYHKLGLSKLLPKEHVLCSAEQGRGPASPMVAKESSLTAQGRAASEKQRRVKLLLEEYLQVHCPLCNTLLLAMLSLSVACAACNRPYA